MLGARGSEDLLVTEFAKLFTRMEIKGGAPEVPVSFVQIFMTLFPQFADRTPDGRAFEQQDADECFTALLS